MSCLMAEPVVLVGGVAGAEAIAISGNSATFRAEGGALYLHNNGWGKLTKEQRAATLRIFEGKPIGIELGFAPGGRARGWANRLKSGYLDEGIRPLFIAANAFAENNHPTAEQWRDFSKTLRASGLPESTLILPTFEYANFAPNIPKLLENTVSRNLEFQSILRTAGGIVLDTPSGYFFRREENYRTWVKDAIQWCKRESLKVVVIFSPNNSGMAFAADTRRYLQWMRDNKAMADWFVVENYNPVPAPGYPNIVGSDSEENQVLGCGLATLRWLKGH